MAIATFNPTPRPTAGSRVTNKVSLIEHQLGNGYVMSAPQGLNHIAKQLDLKWDALTLDQARALDQFFVDQGGYKPFWFTMRGESAPRKWTCKVWSFVDGAPATSSATLMEVFTNIV